MKTIFCPYLERDVILTDERFAHIKKQHPEIIECDFALDDTIKNPDMIRKSNRFQNAFLFTKYFDNIRGGKYAVVVVISDFYPEMRDWIITAYITRKLSQGEILWEKN